MPALYSVPLRVRFLQLPDTLFFLWQTELVSRAQKSHLQHKMVQTPPPMPLARLELRHNLLDLFQSF